MNALRTRTLLREADIVVVRFGEKYKQWNAAFDAGQAVALGTPLITLHPPEHDHALKESTGAALAVAASPSRSRGSSATRSAASSERGFDLDASPAQVYAAVVAMDEDEFEELMGETASRERVIDALVAHLATPPAARGRRRPRRRHPREALGPTRAAATTTASCASTTASARPPTSPPSSPT